MLSILKKASRNQETKKQPTRLRKIINLTVFFLATLYVALTPSLLFAGLEFAPTPYNAAEYAVAEKIPHEEVSLPLSNGLKLHGWFFKKKGAKQVVVLHHGNGENIAFYFPTAEVFLKSGASVMMYDYEGYGKSEGKPSNEALRRDAEAAYQFVRNVKHFDPKFIVHCGISLGTGVACDIAARQPCAGVFLVSPYLSISKVAKRLIPTCNLYPGIAFPQPDLGAETLIVTKKIPMLMIHGVKDILLPIEQADEIFRRAQGPKQYYRVADGLHLGALGEGVEPICKKWLDGLPQS